MRECRHKRTYKFKRIVPKKEAMELKKQGVWVKRMRDAFPNARHEDGTLLYMTESTGVTYDELEQTDKWYLNRHESLYSKYMQPCDESCPKDAVRYCMLPSCIRLYKHEGECSFHPDMRAK